MEQDLEKYAKEYDNLLNYKPSYKEVLNVALDSLKNRLPPGDGRYRIGELGAGTGNFTKKLASAYPDSEIYALDYCKGFVNQLKKNRSGNVSIIRGDAEKNNFKEGSLDAIVMIHVLRLTQNADKGYAIQAASEQLKEGGYFITADIGRKLDMKNHGKEILSTAYNELGLLGTFKLYYNSRDAIKFNKKCEEMEDKWPKHMLHTLDEFKNKIEKFNFEILEARDDLYLGDDDFVVAKKV
ncbi:MAG: class I SAM-dependent methyltransferase [Nanoarchaeota archaeon]